MIKKFSHTYKAITILLGVFTFILFFSGVSVAIAQQDGEYRVVVTLPVIKNVGETDNTDGTNEQVYKTISARCRESLEEGMPDPKKAADVFSSCCQPPDYAQNKECLQRGYNFLGAKPKQKKTRGVK